MKYYWRHFKDQHSLHLILRLSRASNWHTKLGTTDCSVVRWTLFRKVPLYRDPPSALKQSQKLFRKYPFGALKHDQVAVRSSYQILLSYRKVHPFMKTCKFGLMPLFAIASGEIEMEQYIRRCPKNVSRPASFMTDMDAQAVPLWLHFV